MKISCKQFEELIPFYVNNELSDSLKNAFVEHLHNCPNCHIKFNMLNSIVSDLKDAYNQLIFENPETNPNLDFLNEDELNGLNSDLSAYIDNELDDNLNVEIRRNIISKPNVRKKIEKLYSVRKLMSDSFNEEKNRLRTDFSKDIIKKIRPKYPQSETYTQCFLFVIFVISMVIASAIIIKSVL